MSKIDEMILKPATWQMGDYIAAKAALKDLILAEAFPSGEVYDYSCCKNGGETVRQTLETTRTKLTTLFGEKE